MLKTVLPPYYGNGVRAGMHGRDGRPFSCRT